MSAQEPIIWLNGKLVPASAARISPFDRGFTVGCAAFETLIARRGKPFAVSRHWKRLAHSCQILGIRPPLADEFNTWMTQTLEANQLQDARVRFTVTAGDGSNVPADSTSGQTFVVHAVPNQKYAIRERIMKVDWPRNERSALKGAKCASYAENIIALNHAHRHGFGEAIFANTHGDICEGATTNVFFIQGEEVLTPSTASGCLPGITREIVLDICRLNGIPFRESKIPVTFLEEAGECFLTSSTRGIQPVGQINERHLPEKPVSLTQRISTFYHKLFKENDNP